MDPAGKTALVTGAARRVGRALSIGLAKAGADVIVHYHSSADEAQEVVAAIEAAGRNAVAVRADLSEGREIDWLVGVAARAFGRLHILVNSASRFDSASFESITEAGWDRVFAVNLRAPFLLSQKAAPLLRAAAAADGDAAIINIADLSAFQTWPSYPHHAVSKAGLVHLTRQLARVLAPDVRANCIAPGTVLPPEGYEGEDDAGGRERRVLERSGSPEDVLEALLHLVRADFVTGTTLVVDGGRLLL